MSTSPEAPHGFFYSTKRKCPDCPYETFSRDAYWEHRATAHDEFAAVWRASLPLDDLLKDEPVEKGET